MSSRRLREGPILNFKAVLMGEGCVGKTSLVLRYMEDKFNAQHLSTLQAAFVTKKVTLPDERRAQLNIWDTAGQERYHALGPIYYRGSDGALLVYDITDHDSFLKVKSWVRELKQMRGSEIVLIIVGNKTDLEEQRAVVYDTATQYARTVGAQYMETSAKDNEGVSEVFELLTQLMIEHHHGKQEDEPNSLRLQSGVTTSSARALVVGPLDDADPATMLDRGPAASAHRSCCGI
ncbi:ras-related protein Rab-21 [Scaptodrosophila lebanonensis]|uniref:Ras-related protein Rab-21 n=1 Tax=Drosophila lebanonensis TaxID=7225 RepID=A0A6J2TXY9_DROLE|nr:ras-related protein Rab-21 [Scaptodrosophila lebanonensis]